MQFLQEYWWCIISLLGALLVMLLFVQGGQTFLFSLGRGDENRKRILLNAFGRKWGFTFTTLVTFGGAVFASFPKFYSVSFGGATYLWVAILLAMVIQAVSYEYRSKENNVLGPKTFDTFLTINGFAAPLLLGVAVGTFFFGAEFSFHPSRILNNSYNYMYSTWGSPWHGLEALTDYRNLILGVAVLFLARTLGLLYVINCVADKDLVADSRKKLKINGTVFLVSFLSFLFFLLTADGLKVMYNVNFTSIAYPYYNQTDYLYLHNFIDLPLVSLIFAAGVISVLVGIATGAFTKSTSGIWYAATGAVLVVFALFIVSAWNGTSFYRSLSYPVSSLSLSNSSSSMQTLTVMTYVSLLIPVVLAYIWWAWRSINKRKIDTEELNSSDESY